VIVLAVAVQSIYTYLDLFSMFVLQPSQEIVLPFVRTFRREALAPLGPLWLILVVGPFINAIHWGERADAYDESVGSPRAATPSDVALGERPADVDGVDDDIVAERVYGVDSDDADLTPAAIGNGDCRNGDMASDAADSVDDASEAGERR